MPLPTLTLPPGAVPVRGDFTSDTAYREAVDDWMDWWAGVPAQANALAAGMDDALEQAIGAVSGSVLGTSTSSVAIGTGSKVFATQAGKNWVVGSFLTTASAANTANYMFGQITAYSGTSLTVNVEQTGGAGTHADWNIAVAPPPRPPGYTQIGSTVTTTGAASITLANIPSSYGDLIVLIEGLSHNGGGVGDITLNMTDNGINSFAAVTISPSVSANAVLRGTIEVPGYRLNQGLATALLSTSLASNRSAAALSTGETMVQWRLDGGVLGLSINTTSGVFDVVSVSLWGK